LRSLGSAKQKVDARKSSWAKKGIASKAKGTVRGCKQAGGQKKKGPLGVESKIESDALPKEEVKASGEKNVRFFRYPGGGGRKVMGWRTNLRTKNRSTMTRMQDSEKWVTYTIVVSYKRIRRMKEREEREKGGGTGGHEVFIM